ncbi:MAG: SoxR reducing system RseC family protein [Planctomycetota bacterium]|nr:SoxR reducing system RseC family protein [Planctomycetota bacterium]
MSETKVLHGIVLETKKSGVVVRVPLLSDGEDCGGSCPECGLCASAPPLDLEAEADAAVAPPLPGDRVSLSYRPPKRAAMAALFFVPALVGLLGGILAGSGFGEIALVFFALAGTAAGFAVAAGLIRLLEKSIGSRARIVASGKTGGCQ